MFGASDGLTVSLKIREDDLDYLCGGSVDGFKVFNKSILLSLISKPLHKTFLLAAAASAKRNTSSEQILLSSSNETRSDFFGQTHIHGYFNFTQRIRPKKVLCFRLTVFCKYKFFKHF